MRLPKAKSENFVVLNLPDEVLVYDLTTNKAFCLNETSAKVFNACDGATTIGELQDKYQFTDEIVYLALDELKKNNLLTSDYVSPFAGESRRQLIRRIGLASLVALPVISALVAPHPIHAASTTSSCQTNVCLAPNTDTCAGCAGNTITYTVYASTNTTCVTTLASTSVPCNGAPQISNTDRRITSFV